jgi:cobalt-precorrin 5A hydrolase
MLAVSVRIGEQSKGASVIVVGVGSRRGVSVGELRAAVDAVLGEAGLGPGDVTSLATIDRRAGDLGVRELVLDLGWRLAGWSAVELARQGVPHPSPGVGAAVGTPSVAEAAALLAAGPGSELIVPKRVFRCVTAAVARGSIDTSGS